MSDTRINAVVETHTRLFRLETKEWDDYMLDTEDDVLMYIIDTAPTGMDEGFVFVGILDDEDKPTPSYDFMLSNNADDRLHIEDTFNDRKERTQSLSDVRTVTWSVINEGWTKTIY